MEALIAAYRAEIERLQKTLDEALTGTDEETAMQIGESIADLEEEIAFLVVFGA